MRSTVQPPPTTRCELCGGQLVLKRTDITHSILGLMSNVFVCATCGTEQSFMERQGVGASQLSRRVAYSNI